jgi:mannose-6-phosphate isomerase-like protein (cupin superfamily)
VIHSNDFFTTMKMPLHHSYQAPDGSYIWKLPDVRHAGLCKCVLPAGHISSAKRHKTVDEIWHFVSGSGQLWRKRDGEKEIITDIESELSVTIPVGTHFQFKNIGDTDLVVLIVTSTIWPGEEEAESVPNYW